MKQRSNKRLLVIITMVFLIPMVLASYLYARGRPIGHSTSNGALITPPISLVKDGNSAKDTLWHGKWTMLMLAPHDCDRACQSWLHQMRQIHIATGKHQATVQRVLLSGQPLSDSARQQLQKNYPKLVIKSKQRVPMLDHLAHGHPKVDLEHSAVYLVDPQGYLMMSYVSTAKPMGILKDLKHLLRLSS